MNIACKQCLAAIITKTLSTAFHNPDSEAVIVFAQIYAVVNWKSIKLQGETNFVMEINLSGSVTRMLPEYKRKVRCVGVCVYGIPMHLLMPNYTRNNRENKV